jgi:hypothetical protein
MLVKLICTIVLPLIIGKIAQECSATVGDEIFDSNI